MTGFLSRWSQLKRGEAREPAPAPAPEPAPAPAAPEVVAEEPFDLGLLPPLEALTAESDISLFLHKAVPPGLRHAALKRIWALDPAIRDFVGPVDYAWDFNAPGGLPGIAEAFSGDVTELLARAIGAPLQPAAAATVAPPEAPAELPAEPPVAAMLAETAAEPPALDAAPARRHGGAVPI